MSKTIKIILRTVNTLFKYLLTSIIPLIVAMKLKIVIIDNMTITNVNWLSMLPLMGDCNIVIK